MIWHEVNPLFDYRGEPEWLCKQALGRHGVFMILWSYKGIKKGFHGYLNDIKIVESPTMQAAEEFCEDKDRQEDPFRGSYLTGYDDRVTVGALSSGVHRVL